MEKVPVTLTSDHFAIAKFLTVTSQPYTILPRDALQRICKARYMLWPGVSLSVTCRYCIETAEPIELIFGTESTVGVSYTLCYRRLGYLQK